MAEEKEVKLRILEDNFDSERLRDYLKKKFELDFKEKETVDTYYDTGDNLFFNLNHALRIREKQNNSVLTYKALFKIPERKENDWFVLEEEKEIPLSRKDMEEFLEIIKVNKNRLKIPEKAEKSDVENILSQAGFKKTIEINKKSYEAENENVSFSIDYIKNLGLFLEIEVQDDKTLKKILEKINIIFKEERFGYTNLYAKEVMGKKIPDFSEKYEKYPDWNYLEGQKEIVKEMMKKKFSQKV